MKGYAPGELLHLCVCLVLLCSVDSFNWTAQPTNPTEARKGQDLPLTWSFSLLPEEQTKSQSFYAIVWRKLNHSTSAYEKIASKTFLQAFGLNYGEPFNPHIVIIRGGASDSVTLQISDVKNDDEGSYKIEYSLETSGAVLDELEMNLTVVVPPEIDFVSSDQDVCEGHLVTLSCNTTGKPTPNITWTRVADGEQLPAVDGNYIMSNISRSSNGTYRCTAANGVGDPVNRTVQVRVRYSPSVDRIVNSSNTVNESSSFYMTCEASGDPPPYNYAWKRNDTNKVAGNGDVLNFTNINRNDTGWYRCEATNQCGADSGLQFVDVYFPPDITHISDNQTVIQNDSVTLNCTADGHPPPDITWTRVSDNSNVTFPLTVKIEDEGYYRCTADNSIGSSATKDVFITVHYPPNIIHISVNQNKNDGDEVKLNCTADGNPTPNISWTVGNIKKHFGSSYPLTINGKQDEGVYTCTADNGIGSQDSDNVSITVEEYRPINTKLTTPNLTVNLSESFTLTCSSQANPPARYRFYREQESLFNTTVGNNTAVNTTSVNERIKQVTYSCTPVNKYGDGPTETITVTVQFNPLTVNLTSTTENEDCSGSMRVNFTCVASDANPPVTNYQLLEIGGDTSVSNSGAWINKEISEGGKHVYSCLAEHPLGNVTSANTVNLTLNVPVQISLSVPYGNATLEEDGDVYLYCNATGFPPPTVTWTKDGGVLNETTSWVNFTNINRHESGNYTCHGNNICGKNSSSETRINVLYKPENVHLRPPSGSVCKGSVVTFTCTAWANPPVHTYRLLYENGSMIANMSVSGVWIRTLNTGGQFNYSCNASNSLGTGTSNDSTLTVEVSASVVSAENKTVNESGSVTLICNVSGVPSPNVSWIFEDRVIGKGAMWNLLDVRRSRNGSYKYECFASNRCGNDSKTAFIDVQSRPLAEKPELALEPVCNGSFKSIPCLVVGYPEPAISWYKGNDTSGTLLEGESGKVLRRNESGCYTCYAENILGNFTVKSCFVYVPEITVMRITLVITNKQCNNFSEEELIEEIKKIVESRGGLVCPEMTIRCGSVIVDLVLRFNQSVSVDDVISDLKTAAQQSNFGGFVVDPESIKQTSSSSTTSPSPTATVGTKVPVCEETFLKNADCSTIVWKIVVLAVAGVVLIVIVAGIIAWWVHKRRKCRKDSRIHNSEERLHGNAEDNACSQVNHGYAGTGPRPNGTEAVALQQRAAADGSDAAAHQQEAAAIPTYAEVDKSKKKRKAEEKLDYTYAEVDKSKKSKKKPKSGEMIYADLEDINVPRPMPTVSTSPQPLPPIKRPEPYENTQYADITQFLKGDATLPQSDSNQGTELQPQGANKDEDDAGGEDRNTPM